MQASTYDSSESVQSARSNAAAQQAQLAAAALAAMAAVRPPTSRLPIALHVAQSELPLTHVEPRSKQRPYSLVASVRDKRSSYAQPPDAGPSSLSAAAATLTLGGSGYGPPVLSGPTPVQSVVSAALSPGADGKQRDYDMVVVPLSNASWQARWEAMCVASADEASAPTEPSPEERATEAERWRAGGGFGRGEVNLTRSEEVQLVMVQAAEWLELDSSVEGIRFDSELALKQEVAYASHLGIHTIVLPPPRNPEFAADYARAINTALAASTFITVRRLADRTV